MLFIKKLAAPFFFIILFSSLSIGQEKYFDTSFGKKGKLSFKLNTLWTDIACDQNSNLYLFYGEIYNDGFSPGAYYWHKLKTTKYDSNGNLVKDFGKKGSIEMRKHVNNYKLYPGFDINKNRIIMYDLSNNEFRPTVYDQNGQHITELNLNLESMIYATLHLTENPNEIWLRKLNSIYRYKINKDIWYQEDEIKYINPVSILTDCSSKKYINYENESLDFVIEFKSESYSDSIKISRTNYSNRLFCGILSNKSSLFQSVVSKSNKYISILHAYTEDDEVDTRFGDGGTIALTDLTADILHIAVDKHDNIYVQTASRNKNGKFRQYIYKLKNVLK